VEPTNQPALTSAYYLSVLRRRRRIVIACALIGALLGALYVVSRPSGYTSSASVVIRPVTTTPFENPNQQAVSAVTEQSVMASTVVAQRAAGIIGRSADPEDILKHLTVTNPTDTSVLTATFRASSPEKARQGAQAFADSYLDYRQSQYDATKDRTLASIDAQLATLRDSSAAASAAQAKAAPGSEAYIAAQQQVDRLQSRIIDAETNRATIDAIDTSPGEVIKPAKLPTGTSGVPRALTVVATTVLGAMIGVVAALVRQRTDPFLRTRLDFTEVFDRPPLGEVHRVAGNGGRAALLAPELAEYRHLRVRLWPTRPPKFQKILVADVENASTSARLVSGLAVSLANAHWRVLVVWPDSPGTQFDIRGLKEFDGVRLLPWSAVEGYSGESIDPTSLIKVLDDATEIDDVVLLAAQPIQSATEGPELYSLVDGVLVSFDPTSVRTDVLEAALDEVATMGGEVAGVVVSPVPGRW
jgi:polysaccharide biosynthesis transport protein